MKIPCTYKHFLTVLHSEMKTVWIKVPFFSKNDEALKEIWSASALRSPLVAAPLNGKILELMLWSGCGCGWFLRVQPHIKTCKW